MNDLKAQSLNTDADFEIMKMISGYSNLELLHSFETPCTLIIPNEHPTVIVFCSWQKIILRSQKQKMMNDFDWILFLVFTKIHFLLSTQNNFSFQQKTFLVFITEHISFSPQFVFLVSTKIIFRFQPKSFFGVIQKSFFVVTQNQFWSSPEINFGFHLKLFFGAN